MSASPISFHSGRVVIHAGDCLDVLDAMEADSVDAVVTDPPYHLTSIVKRFGKTSKGDDNKTSERARAGADGLARMSRGFMGKEWDGGDIAFRVETWAKVFRVLKPGGHVVAFSAPKCSHRMVCAIEDAGFEIRDGLMWMFGTGFPKSHDVSKGIDRAAGAVREVVGRKTGRAATPVCDIRGGKSVGGVSGGIDLSAITSPATPDAEKWAGWGTALKPAYEPICLARKPLGEKTVAANVLAHGVGGLNIDGCKVGEGARRATATAGISRKSSPVYGDFAETEDEAFVTTKGRWPANVCHDGSAEVVAAFPETGAGGFPASRGEGGIGNNGHKGQPELIAGKTDSGSAARFFYSAKADAGDRLGSKHPTVKPVDLMRWLCRLVTPPGGTILDLFAGTGTTAEAALLENFSAVLIEREAEYRADIARRMAHVFTGAASRKVAIAKAKGSGSHESLPLFGPQEAAE